jgi:hypothetical protein
MDTLTEPVVPLGNTDHFFIDGEWIKLSSGSTTRVIDSATNRDTTRHRPLMVSTARPRASI